MGIAMATLLESVETPALVVKMPSSVVEMNDDQFFDFARLTANFELNAPPMEIS
jgi:hypothetical protein